MQALPGCTALAVMTCMAAASMFAILVWGFALSPALPNACDCCLLLLKLSGDYEGASQQFQPEP